MNQDITCEIIPNDLKSDSQDASSEILTYMDPAWKDRTLPQGCGSMHQGDFNPRARAILKTPHRLYQVLAGNAIASILDIGCVLPTAVQAYRYMGFYIGLHTNQNLLGFMAQSFYRDYRYLFFELFPKIANLPETDAIFLDVSSLSEDDCWYLFSRIKISKAKYLMAPYMPTSNDLCALPFGFPEPDHILNFENQLLGFWNIAGLTRRFLSKEPDIIRRIRTPLTTQLQIDFATLYKKILPDKNLELFMQLWTKTWKENDEAFETCKLKELFKVRGIDKLRKQIFSLFYARDYENFLPDYRGFATNDPNIQCIQSYLTHQALFDFADCCNIALEFGYDIEDPEHFIKEATD